jgi:hypothetical protein
VEREPREEPVRPVEPVRAETAEPRLRPVLVRPVLVLVRELPVRLLPVRLLSPAAPGVAAMPQVSQYPSSIRPEQPGRWQRPSDAAADAVPEAREAADARAAGAADAEPLAAEAAPAPEADVPVAPVRAASPQVSQ